MGRAAFAGCALKLLVVDDRDTVQRSAENGLKAGERDVGLAEDGFDARAKSSDYRAALMPDWFGRTGHQAATRKAAIPARCWVAQWALTPFHLTG